MRFAAIVIAAAAALPASALAQSAAAEEPARTIAFELREGGTVVAAPTVRVQLGRPAALSIGEYSLRLRMVRADAAEGAPYVIRSSLYRSEGGWALVASPTLTVAEGQQASARFAGSDGTELSLAVSLR